MKNKVCPCKKLKCPRHGDCDACRAYHAVPGRKYPCACDKKNKVESTREGVTRRTPEAKSSQGR